MPSPPIAPITGTASRKFVPTTDRFWLAQTFFINDISSHKLVPSFASLTNFAPVTGDVDQPELQLAGDSEGYGSEPLTVGVAMSRSLEPE